MKYKHDTTERKINKRYLCLLADSGVQRTLCSFFWGFLFGFYSLSCVTCVASFYGLSILSYHFSILYRLLTLAHLMLRKCHLVCIISQLWIKVNSIVILCVCVHSGVQHTLCCVFDLFYFVLCTLYFSCYICMIFFTCKK